MIKQRLISIVAACAMLLSFSITASAVDVAATSINPTFSVVENPELVDGQYEYQIGITYDGDAFNMVKSKGKWTGTGLRNLGMSLDLTNVPLDWSEAVAGSFEESSCEYLLNISDTAFHAVASGEALFKIYTNEQVALENFVCTKLQLTVGSVNAGTITFSTMYSNNQSDVDGGFADYLSYAAPKAQEATKYAVTVTGGTADVAEAEEGQVVTVTANIPEGKQIASVTGADVTKTGDATYTFTMPAAAVEIVIAYEDIPAPEFSAVATKSATQYYTGVAEDVKTVQVFDVTATNPELAQWIFTFTSGADSKEFDADMSAISGGASAVFQAWIVGAPADVQLSVQ